MDFGRSFYVILQPKPHIVWGLQTVFLCLGGGSKHKRMTKRRLHTLWGFSFMSSPSSMVLRR